MNRSIYRWLPGMPRWSRLSSISWVDVLRRARRAPIQGRESLLMRVNA
jgi:hypothetical protein